MLEHYLFKFTPPNSWFPEMELLCHYAYTMWVSALQPVEREVDDRLPFFRFRDLHDLFYLFL